MALETLSEAKDEVEREHLGDIAKILAVHEGNEVSKLLDVLEGIVCLPNGKPFRLHELCCLHRQDEGR